MSKFIAIFAPVVFLSIYPLAGQILQPHDGAGPFNRSEDRIGAQPDASALPWSSSPYVFETLDASGPSRRDAYDLPRRIEPAHPKPSDGSLAEEAGPVSASELRNPSSKKALKAIAKAHKVSEAGDHAAAIRELSRATKEFPSDGRLRTNLGVEYLRVGQVADAISELQEAARLLPDSSQAAANLAYAFFVSKKWRPAEDEARRAARLDPSNFKAHFILGSAILAQGSHVEEGIEHLKSSASRLANSRLVLAWFYLRTGQRAAAATELQAFLKSANSSDRAFAERWLANATASPRPAAP